VNASRLKNLSILAEWCSGPKTMRPEARGLAQPEIRHGFTRVPGHAFLRDISHDGWLCTFTNLPYTSSWKFHQLAAWQLLRGQPVQYRKGRRYGPSIPYKIIPVGSLSSSQPGGPLSFANPLAFGLIGTPRPSRTKSHLPGHSPSAS
jgi:hypothetical protein